MKKKMNHTLYSILCLIVIFFVSCRDDIIDCGIDPKNAYLEDKALSKAFKSNVYAETIDVGVTNPVGDYYIYSYTVNGDLPPGLTATSQILNLETSIYITGTPQEAGSYEFEIEVVLGSQNAAPGQASSTWFDDGPYKGDYLCDETASRVYTIEVE